jgi:hypothetical protein
MKTLVTLSLGLMVAPAIAQDVPAPTDKKVEYSPYPGEDFPNQVFFGDTHLHTGYSADAGLVGCTKSPDGAYRFAKGEEVTASSGIRARLQRPLDWLVVERPCGEPRVARGHRGEEQRPHGHRLGQGDRQSHRARHVREHDRRLRDLDEGDGFC